MGLQVIISIVTLVITLVTKSHDPLSGCCEDLVLKLQGSGLGQGEQVLVYQVVSLRLQGLGGVFLM